MESSATGESSPYKGGLGARLAAWALAATLVAALLCLIQQHSGFGLRVRHEIENDRIQQTPDYFRWRLPEQYRTPLVDRTAVLLKDGKPWLNRSVSNKNLREFGAGWFYMVGGGVNFIPNEEMNLRAAAARLSLVTPLQFKPKFWPKLAALIFGQLLLVQWLRRRAGLPLWRGRTAGRGEWEAATLVLALLAFWGICAGLSARADFTDHAYVIKGIQESDAGGWYEMAVGLKEGRGLTGAFENQRPWYTIFLAGLFSLFGEGLGVLRGFNVLALLTGVLAAFTMGRLLGSMVVAVALAALLLMSDMHQNYLHAALTENGGLLLAGVSLLGAWLAAWTLSRRWAAAAGALNGLATLTSGVTLFTLPGYALLLTLFPLWRRAPWQRALQLGVVYTLAASLVVGGWIIRQKIVHDRFALSYNSAEVLAGGSDPEDGRLTVRVLNKARDAGLDLSNEDNRYDSMIKVFKSNVAADPAGYAQRVLQASLDSLAYLPVDDPVVRTVLMLALIFFAMGPWLRHGQWHALALTAGLLALWEHHQWAVNMWLLAAAIYLLLRRSHRPSEKLTVLLLVATALAVMVLAGLSGNVASKRFWLVADWSVLALILGGMRHFIVTSAGLLSFVLRRCQLPAWVAGEPAAPPEAVAALEPPRFIPVSMVTLLALAAICGGLVLGQTLRGPRPLFAGLDPAMGESHLAALLEAAKEREPMLKEVPLASVATRVVLDAGMTAVFAAGEGTQHWMPFYLVRPYERWVSYWRVADREGDFTSQMSAVGSGPPVSLPAGQPLFAAGVFSTGEHRINDEPVPVFEVIFIAPLRQEASVWKPELDSIKVLPPSPEALSAARGQR